MAKYVNQNVQRAGLDIWRQMHITNLPESGMPGIYVAVTNQGEGIAEKELPRLTERFYRVDKGRSRSMGGTGLGLAIVKHIISRHRGYLDVKSEENKETTFTVMLPRIDESIDQTPL